MLEHWPDPPYRVDATGKTVASPFRDGALVVFPVLRVGSITGTVRIESEGVPHIPAYGQMTVTLNDAAHESPIGKQGEFYLGTYRPEHSRRRSSR
jgi:outer membrane usher protein